MSLLPIRVAAQTLGITLPDQTLEIGGFGDPEAGRTIEYAARTRAVERFPLLGEPADIVLIWAQHTTRSGTVVRGNARDGLSDDVVALDRDTATEWSKSSDPWARRAGLAVLEEAPRAARPTEPNDGGQDGCPPAAVRHVLAGALVASLVTGAGFPYGDPPEATEADFDRVPDGALTVLGDESADYPDAPHYALANALCEAALGVSAIHDREGPSNNQTPAEVQAAAIDLAIDLLCAPEPMAEIAAGFAAWLLSQYRSSWAAARARRMMSLVGVRFPREVIP